MASESVSTLATVGPPDTTPIECATLASPVAPSPRRPPMLRSTLARIRRRRLQTKPLQSVGVVVIIHE